MRPFPAIFGLAFVGALSSTARAAPLIFDADVPEAPGDFVFVPFSVPEGTVEIEVRHSGLPKDNILDFGLDDPKGFRGWGGGNDEAAIVGVEAASRSYLPGPIAAAEWRVVIGKAKIKVKPAHYHIEIDFRTTATLPKVPRTPYAPPSAPLSTSARWYAGDFHVHSRESGDARPTIDDVATFAASRKLDFIELSDHNTVSQDSLIAAAQAKTRILLIPGVEYTTYAGHGNAIGATAWIDHRIGTSSTILQAVDAIHAQGALFSINHPGLDIGDQCIGCGWKHDLPADKVDAIEIETGALKPVGFLFHPLAINLWEKQLATGAHIAALGGSDDHSAGIETDAKSSPIGSPTTLVFARELSTAAIIEAIRNGRTVVKLQGPDDPMVELTTDVALDRDTVKDEFVTFRLKVTGGGQAVRLVKNGIPLDEVKVASDPFLWQKTFDAPATGEDRYRAEVMNDDDKTQTITSHVFVKYAKTGRARPIDPAAPAAVASSCGCTVVGQRGYGAGLSLSLSVVAVSLARRRRRAGIERAVGRIG